MVNLQPFSNAYALANDLQHFVELPLSGSAGFRASEGQQ
jgi:hypothetical protein